MAPGGSAPTPPTPVNVTSRDSAKRGRDYALDLFLRRPTKELSLAPMWSSRRNESSERNGRRVAVANLEMTLIEAVQDPEDVAPPNPRASPRIDQPPRSGPSTGPARRARPPSAGRPGSRRCRNSRRRAARPLRYLPPYALPAVYFGRPRLGPPAALWPADRGSDRCGCRRERRGHPVTHRREHHPIMISDRLAEKLVVARQGCRMAVSSACHRRVEPRYR